MILFPINMYNTGNDMYIKYKVKQWSLVSVYRSLKHLWEVPASKEAIMMYSYQFSDDIISDEVIRVKDVKDFGFKFWLLCVICVAYYVAVFPFIGLGL